MKFLFVLLSLLLTVALSSASYPCGPNNCGVGQVCRTINNQCSCVPINDCHEITLSQRVVGSWVDSSCGLTYTQYDVTIHNNLNIDVKDVFISFDSSLSLRAPASSNIWNIVQSPKGLLSLPSYQTSINAGASYVFGFILVGTTPANLNIVAFSY